MNIKIVISGIGGVGGYYGGMLAAHYAQSQEIQISFIARGKNMEAIRTNGLQIRTSDKIIEARPAQITDRPAEIGQADYLFCSTKVYDLEHNLSQLSPLIGPQTIIIPLLNGADITEHIRSLLPEQQVWYGCVYIGARLAAPGIITNFTERNRLWFGDPKGDHQRQQQLLKILTDANIDAKNPADIILRIWKKFFLISLSATLTSFYNQSIGEILQFHRGDYFRLGKELAAIATARGIDLPKDMTDRVIADQSKLPPEATTSMHTDYKNDKPTELESLTGYVVHSGKELHLATPLYEKMYNKLKSIYTYND